MSGAAGGLVIESLTAGYDGIPIVRGLSLAVAPGEVVALLGRNGVGKTTLARAVAGLLRPMSGRVLLGGADVTAGSASSRARAGIGYVPQGRGIFSRLTVAENMRMGALVGGGASRPDVEAQYAAFPALDKRRAQKAGTLSGGEQQMLAIGRVLAGAPRLLLLDEPSEGVQPNIVDLIGEVIARRARESGLAVLLIEQNIDLVLMIAQRCLIVEKGTIVAEIDPQSLIDPAVSARWLAV
jgi:ABC-type branched-subunit amino acid transport system ATPase component